MQQQKRLKGSSLVEVLTAMVIILVILGLASSLFVTLSRQRADKPLQVQQQLAILAQTTIRQGDLNNREWEWPDSVQVYREVAPYGQDTLLLLLDIRAYQRNGPKPIARYRQLILKEPYENSF